MNALDESQSYDEKFCCCSDLRLQLQHKTALHWVGIPYLAFPFTARATAAFLASLAFQASRCPSKMEVGRDS